MKKKIEFTTPWCELTGNFNYATMPDGSSYEIYFCESGLRKWNIPEGAAVRIHITNYRVKGAQRRIYVAGNLMQSLHQLALSEHLWPGDTVWWWPEVRT